MSKYEAMRTDPANWKMGFVYYCAQDSRIVVRQRLPVGWTWNFGHPKVYLAILIAVLVFLSPPVLAWWLGIRSTLALGLITLMAFFVIVIVASRMSRDPEV